ncbi:MAG: aminotransferase class IV family protein [Anaerolineae bacterium]|nr:aminotransferase class IV family protein [Anaerolineae bacterium]
MDTATNGFILTATLTPAGLQATPYHATSLADAAQYEPPGVYTVTRTYHRTSALKFSRHLKRLEQSARLREIDLTLDRAAWQDGLRAALRQLIDQAGYAESRFRITIPADTPETAYFAIEPLNPVPAAVKASGVHVRAFPMQRQNPRAKDTRWMQARAGLQAQLNGSYEGLLTDGDGALLEGLGSNFYAILAGELRTAHDGILEGISRRIVMKVAPDVLPVREQPVRLADLPELAEAFLTSSSRGVVPIVQIDDQVIGDGVPGPLTQALSARYDAWAEAHLKPI